MCLFFLEESLELCEFCLFHYFEVWPFKFGSLRHCLRVSGDLLYGYRLGIVRFLLLALNGDFDIGRIRILGNFSSFHFLICHDYSVVKGLEEALFRSALVAGGFGRVWVVSAVSRFKVGLMVS